MKKGNKKKKTHFFQNEHCNFPIRGQDLFYIYIYTFSRERRVHKDDSAIDAIS